MENIVPPVQKKLIPDGVLGMLIFVITEVIFFTGLVSAFMIVKALAPAGIWPPPGQPTLPVQETAINTGALLVSGWFTYVANRSYRKSPETAAVPLAVAIVLGLFFVGFQGVEWVELLGQGLTMTSGSHGAFFYLIVGVHAIHAVVALGMLGWAWFKLRAGELVDSQFWTVQVFWYFVVGLWPVLYMKVYLGW